MFNKFMRLTVASLVVAILAACGGRPPNTAQTADIVSDYGTVFTQFLYYRDGADLVQARCNPNTILYDRASCGQNQVRVDAARFYHELQTESGAHVEQLTAMAAEAFTRVAQVDAKLDELRNATGQTPSRPELAVQIRALEQEFAGHTTVIVGLREQIALLQQALVTANDADQRFQLSVREGEIAARIEARAGVLVQLTTLRQEYTLANVDLLDGQLFQQLQHQRNQALQLWQRYEAALVREGQESVDLQRVIAMLEDDYVHVQGFGSDGDYMGILMGFYDLVEELDRQPMRYATVGRRTDLELAVDVAVPSTLKTMQCRFATQIENRCVAVQVTGPNGLSGQMQNLYLNTRYDQDAGIPANQFINHSAMGRWTFKIVPTCGNQAITLASEPWCELGTD